MGDGDQDPSAEAPPDVDPQEPVQRLLRDLRTSAKGLSAREAARRLIVYGPNELEVFRRRTWLRDLGAQLIHPLALLLWAAAGLAVVSGTPTLTVAIIGVIVLNAGFAFAQEQQAQRAVEALSRYLPQQARVIRGGVSQLTHARQLVPGDILLVAEGDRISADARLLAGSVQVDMSTLTGESAPVTRSLAHRRPADSLLEAHGLLFSGTACTAGEATAVVYATGRRSELGRIAALSQHIRREPSPLELQVKRVAWLIAAVAVLVGLAFLPLGILAGLSAQAAVLFSVGLLVANVPEGLLPTITLALAVGVRDLASRGALVKRLSAVETLGSTSVICTDKTGTLTENRMKPEAVWLPNRAVDLGGEVPLISALHRFGEAMAACTTARLAAEGVSAVGDSTELAVVRAAELLGADVDPDVRDAARVRVFAFEPERARMSTVSHRHGRLVVE